MYGLKEDTLILIKKNLLEDLAKRGSGSLERVDIDFSDAIGEGSGVDYNGEFLECSSNIVIRNKDNKLVGEGWVDYLLDENNKLYCYWSHFTTSYGDISMEVQAHSVPSYLWNEFSEETKNYLAKTHQGWSGDRKLLPYRRIHYPIELKNVYNEAVNLLPSMKKLNLGKRGNDALESLMKRTEDYINGKFVERKLERDVYDIEESIRYQLFEQHKSRVMVELLNNLEYSLNQCQLILPQLSDSRLMRLKGHIKRILTLR